MRQSYEDWLRLVALVECTGRRFCYEIMHTKEGIPDDGVMLYSMLSKYKIKVLYQMYEDILCPSDKIIDETKFNLSLYSTVFRFMFGDKYKNPLQEMRNMRNSIFHMENISNCTRNFQELWTNVHSIFPKNGFGTELSILRCGDLFSVEMYKGNVDFLLLL